MRIPRQIRRTRSQDGSKGYHLEDGGNDHHHHADGFLRQNQQVTTSPSKPLTLRRTKSHDEVNHLICKKIPMKKFGLRRNRRRPHSPRGLGDNLLNDLDESITESSTMDSSCASHDGSSAGGHHMRTTTRGGILRKPLLLRRTKTFSGSTAATASNTPATMRRSTSETDAEAPTTRGAGGGGMTQEQQARHNRLKELPSTANYASCHILVNRERIRMNKTPLHRSRDLDAIARQRAQDMAKDHGTTYHQRLQIPDGSLVETIQKGPSIHIIHQMIMSCDESRNTLLSDQYTRFGVGCWKDTTPGGSGLIYMSQIFQAPKSTRWTQELQLVQQQKQSSSSSHLYERMESDLISQVRKEEGKIESDAYDNTKTVLQER